MIFFWTGILDKKIIAMYKRKSFENCFVDCGVFVVFFYIFSFNGYVV